MLHRQKSTSANKCTHNRQADVVDDGVFLSMKAFRHGRGWPGKRRAAEQALGCVSSRILGCGNSATPTPQSTQADLGLVHLHTWISLISKVLLIYIPLFYTISIVM